MLKQGNYHGNCQRLVLRPMRRLGRLVLYKDMKVFGNAVNDAGGSWKFSMQASRDTYTPKTQKVNMSMNESMSS